VSKDVRVRVPPSAIQLISRTYGTIQSAALFSLISFGAILVQSGQSQGADHLGQWAAVFGQGFQGIHPHRERRTYNKGNQPLTNCRLRPTRQIPIPTEAKQLGMPSKIPPPCKRFSRRLTAVPSRTACLGSLAKPNKRPQIVLFANPWHTPSPSNTAAYAGQHGGGLQPVAGSEADHMRLAAVIESGRFGCQEDPASGPRCVLVPRKPPIWSPMVMSCPIQLLK
jgi:hypothetical protein